MTIALNYWAFTISRERCARVGEASCHNQCVCVKLSVKGTTIRTHRGHVMLSIEMLSEPVSVPDTYVTELGGIEDAGDGMVRFVFCARQKSAYDPHETETVIRVRLVAGPTLIWHTIRMTMQHFGQRCCGAFRGVHSIN